MVVELRLNCNLHDLTLEQILAKMQRTHFDLLDIVRTDISLLGFPDTATQALVKHEAEFKRGDRDPQWFNSAANYLDATERALRCKHRVCSAILLDQSASDTQRKKAIEVLLDPNDAMALKHGIACIFRHGLSDRYSQELEHVSTSPALKELALDLKGAGLTGA